MKVLGNLDIVKKSDVNVPFGAVIQNETDTQEGTPVIDDVLNDVLVNLYKLLVLTNETPTDDLDSDLTQYQIINALKKLPNSTNDVEQVLTVSGTTVSVDLDLSLLPNKYFFFGRPTENFSPTSSFTLQGNTNENFAFRSQGLSINASDELLVIIDIGGVRVYNLSPLNSTPKQIFTPLGTPIPYNNSSKIYYQESGKLFNDDLNIYDVQGIIRTELSDSTVLVNEMMIYSGHVLCFCFIPSSINYFFRQFELSDMTVSTAVTIVGATLGNSVDYSPYVLFNGVHLYISNASNTVVGDDRLDYFSYDTSLSKLTYNSNLNMENSFTKTTNNYVGTYFYTLINGVLKKYNSSVLLSTTTLPTSVGQLFSYKGEPYICTGETATKLILP